MGPRTPVAFVKVRTALAVSTEPAGTPTSTVAVMVNTFAPFSTL